MAVVGRGRRDIVCVPCPPRHRPDTASMGQGIRTTGEGVDVARNCVRNHGPGYRVGTDFMAVGKTPDASRDEPIERARL